MDHSFKNLDKLQEIPRELIEGAVEGDERKEAEIEEQAEEVGEQAEETGEQAEEIEEQKIEDIQISLNNVQQILYEFVEKKLSAGWDMREIENMLEEHSIEGNYSIIDVSKVINYALENQFKSTENLSEDFPEINHENVPESVTTKEKQKVYKEEVIPHKQEGNKDIPEGDEQERFLAFLQNNPDHDYSTVDIYKKLGLSARKGNKIKTELMERGLIQIQEQKNSKGWKKLIRLAE